ncbi:MAG: hypothetical protein QOI78_9322 [Actinomycetota bacterium]|nr:hypothetical protein [Actinomycetota bacterium]
MFGTRNKSRRRTVGAALAAAALILVATAGQAAAYDGNAAANYADIWAKARNSDYPAFDADCTNFVSQAVSHGGFSMVNYLQSPNSVYSWWIERAVGSQFSWSLTWSVANSYYNFLLAYSPGGVREGTAPGTATNYYTPDSVITGDVLFYDWGQGEGISHAAIQTGIGTDFSGFYGNYVDYHTTDRYHAFWSLVMYNSLASTTTVYFVHIFPNNY